MMITLLLLLAQAGRPSELNVGPPANDSRGGRVCLFEARANGANSVCIQAETNIASDLTLVIPSSGDGVLRKTGSTLAWSPGGAVSSVGVNGPISNTGTATDPILGCPTCMRLDGNNTPTGLFDLGTLAAPWSNIRSVTFRAVGGLICENSAYMQGSAAFGGEVSVRDSSCQMQARLTGNGFDTGSIGAYRVLGVPVIEPDRDLTNIKDVSFTGTMLSGAVPWARITGAPSFVSAVSASSPLSGFVNGNTAILSCPTCVRMGNNDINTPGFNVQIGTPSNWILSLYAQNHYSPNGFCLDASGMTSNANFGGTIYAKDGSCVVRAQMNGTGFDTVQPFAAYKVQGVTVIDSLRAANFSTVNATNYSGLSASLTTVSASNYVAGFFSGISRTINVMCSGGTPGSITTTSGLVTGSTCP